MATGYSVTFTVIDEATAPIERINRRIREMREPIERMSRSVQKFIDPVGLEKKADEFRTITRTVGEASSALSRLVPLMGTLTGAASVAGMAELAKSAAAFGNSLLRVSTRTRLTTNQLQDLQYGYQRFGGNTDDMTEAVGALSDKLGEAQTGNQQAATGFAALGVKIVDSQGHLRTTNDVIDETIDKLGALKDPFDRIRIASMLGSKNLALVSERLQRLHKNMQDLHAEGAIVPHLTPQQIEDTDKYNVAVGKVTSSVSALGTQLGATLDKNLTPFMDKWDTFTRDSTPSIVGAFDKITAAILHQIDASITENEKLVEAAKKGDWWEFLFGEAGKPLAVPAAPATTGPAIPGRFSSGRLPPPGPVVPGRGVPTPPGFLPLEMRPTPPGPIAPPVVGPPHFGAVPGRGPPPERCPAVKRISPVAGSRATRAAASSRSPPTRRDGLARADLGRVAGDDPRRKRDRGLRTRLAGSRFPCRLAARRRRPGAAGRDRQRRGLPAPGRGRGRWRRGCRRRGAAHNSRAGQSVRAGAGHLRDDRDTSAISSRSPRNTRAGAATS